MQRSFTFFFLLILSHSLLPAGEVTMRSLLEDMINLEALARFPAPPFVTRQASSYDRASKDPRNEETWFANGDSGQYVRVEERGGQKEHVMLDAEGPGAVVRIWSANPEGTLRIYIDGDAEPALEAPMGDLLRGKVKPFVAPVAQEVARGCNIYFPFTYAKHVKITSDKGGFYYHANYRTYPEGTNVESYSAAKLKEVQSDLDRVVAVLSDPQEAYKPSPKHHRTDFQLGVSAGGSSRVTIPALPGGEVIRALVLRPSRKDPETLRQTILVARFDAEETVVVPLGDFFGSAPGINPYQSLPLSVAADGTLTCRWAMPFQKSAVFELRGDGGSAGEIKTEGHALSEPYAWGDDSLYFHARWRASYDMPTSPPIDWNYITIEGKGLYAGNVLNVANPVKAWWGEGDEKIYVDGETFPSHFGTGTEDYYGYAWSSPERFIHAYHNQTRCDGPATFGYTSVNRWHIIDTIPFTRSFRFDMEVWHWDRKIKVSYDTVNYWYARPGAKDSAPPLRPEALHIPVLPERKTRVVPGAIEGEAMKLVAAAGTAEPQDMSGFAGGLWSGETHLWWHGAKPGDSLVLSFAAPRAGRYRVIAHLTKAVDYGIHQILVNGKKAGGPMDLFNNGVIAAEPLDLGVFELAENENRLAVEITGTNDKAAPKNYMFGLDCIVLVPVAGK